MLVFASARARAQTMTVPGQGGAGQSGAGMTLTADALRDLPASADIFGLLETVDPEVVSDGFESAGLNTGRPPRLGAHGSSWTQTLFRLDHADITSPTRSGTPMLVPELLPWDRIEVRTGLPPIDVNAPGLAITLEPRRPSAAWTAVADGWLAPGSPDDRSSESLGGSAAPSVARLDGWSLADVLVSGPLVPNRLGLVSTGTWARTRSSWRPPFDSRRTCKQGLPPAIRTASPFSRIVVVDVNQGRDVIRAFTNGESRFTYIMTLDARAEKAFHVGPYTLAVVADVFNALNLSHEVEEAVIANGPFRAVAAVQPPRAFRLGARLRF